eukprot:TRINITY_DN10433_c0_g1_i1.p1 TRINITY_DN10433_c0_g1~~TRINITY_DN10433_c0_g1_i1.p1  ORF type:complete len:132 (-),score=34.79 TRINITY_DN10433_c0_g1_i1:100-495(-)
MSDKKLLYVGGLAEYVDKVKLHALFEPFGEVKEVNVPSDDKSGNHRGFAFVEMEDAEDAAQAMDNLTNAEFYGKVLKINYAKPESVMKTRAVWDNDDYLKRDIEDPKAKPNTNMNAKDNVVEEETEHSHED